jgi:hypothetical protein
MAPGPRGKAQVGLTRGFCEYVAPYLALCTSGKDSAPPYDVGPDRFRSGPRVAPTASQSEVSEVTQLASG